MDVLSKNNFIIAVLRPAENLLNECSGIPARTITSAQIARGNCQPFCSVVDCNTGFFLSKSVFKSAKPHTPQSHSPFSPSLYDFRFTTCMFRTTQKRTVLQSSSVQVLLLLAQSCKEWTKWFTYSAVIWTQTSNIVFEYGHLHIFVFVYSFQAGALVHVYTDGSVLVTHGGTEMGQGLHTKMVQVSKKMETKEMQEMVGHGQNHWPLLCTASKNRKQRL